MNIMYPSPRATLAAPPYAYVHTYVSTYVYADVRVFVRVWGAHVRMRVSTRVCACEGAHVRVYVCVSVCMCVRLWMLVCVGAGARTYL